MFHPKSVFAYRLLFGMKFYPQLCEDLFSIGIQVHLVVIYIAAQHLFVLTYSEK